MWAMNISWWGLVLLLLLFYWPGTMLASIGFGISGWVIKHRGLKLIFWFIAALLALFAVIGMVEIGMQANLA